MNSGWFQDDTLYKFIYLLTYLHSEITLSVPSTDDDARDSIA